MRAYLISLCVAIPGNGRNDLAPQVVLAEVVAPDEEMHMMRA
jgi:hypothetical protein